MYHVPYERVKEIAIFMTRSSNIRLIFIFYLYSPALLATAQLYYHKPKICIDTAQLYISLLTSGKERISVKYPESLILLIFVIFYECSVCVF
jgi:hypothetical protein